MATFWFTPGAEVWFEIILPAADKEWFHAHHQVLTTRGAQYAVSIQANMANGDQKPLRTYEFQAMMARERAIGEWPSPIIQENHDWYGDW